MLKVQEIVKESRKYLNKYKKKEEDKDKIQEVNINKIETLKKKYGEI